VTPYTTIAHQLNAQTTGVGHLDGKGQRISIVEQWSASYLGAILLAWMRHLCRRVGLCRLLPRDILKAQVP